MAESGRGQEVLIPEPTHMTTGLDTLKKYPKHDHYSDLAEVMGQTGVMWLSSSLLTLFL